MTDSTSQDTTPTGTVGEFAAFLIDMVAEGLGDAQVVLLTEDHIGDGDFVALDQHADEDGTFARPETVDWASFSLGSFTRHLTQDQGFALYRALKSQFGWSGTVFCRDDVQECVEEDHRSEGRTPQEVTRVVDALMNSRSYSKLDDRFAELGNEILADSVGEAFIDAGLNTND